MILRNDTEEISPAVFDATFADAHAPTLHLPKAACTAYTAPVQSGHLEVALIGAAMRKTVCGSHRQIAY